VEAKGHRDLGHRVLLKRIRQRRATSDQGTVTGYLPAGDNVPGYQGVSCAGPDDCAKMCASVKGCVAWTFQKSTNKCWLKTTNAGVIFNEDWVSGGPSIETDWEGMEITKKEMKNITMAIQVFGDGQDIKRVAKITKESFEDILKRVDDRQKELSKRNVTLTYEAEQAKAKESEMKADLAKKTAELNRQSNQLTRLKGELERSHASLSDGQRDLANRQRELEAKKRAHEEAKTARTVFLVMSCIPVVNLIGVPGLVGSGIATEVISADIDGLKAVVKSRQETVDMHETHMRERKVAEERSKLEVLNSHTALLQLQREQLVIKVEIASLVTKNTICTSLLKEIRGAHVKVIEMNNAANNMDRVAEKAFDMEQMAIPLNELLISLEENIDVLDEGAKAELQLARVKFNKFNSALEAQGGDAVEF